MTIPQEDRSRIKKICMHEAAHLIVAKEMKFTTSGMFLWVAAEAKHSGSIGISIRTKNITTIALLEEYLKRRLKVLFAGVIIEFMDQNGDFNSVLAAAAWRNTGSLDDAKIRELTQILRSIRFPETDDNFEALAESNDLRNSLIQETREMVMNRYAVIEAVANKLFDKIEGYNINYSLSENEICEIEIVKEFLAEIA